MAHPRTDANQKRIAPRGRYCVRLMRYVKGRQIRATGINVWFDIEDVRATRRHALIQQIEEALDRLEAQHRAEAASADAAATRSVT